MSNLVRLRSWAQTTCVAALLSAGCGGNCRGVVASSASLYSVGGTVSGLAGGASVGLRSNGVDNLTLSANGAFAFVTKLPNAARYNVVVASQPAGQTCRVANAVAQIDGAHVSDVRVTCANIGARRALPPGFLDVNSVAGVFPDDPTKDSSDGIQAAMIHAHAANQTLYFPPNATYYVSKTLLGVQPYLDATTCRDPSDRSFRLWGGGRGADRPTIVLTDRSAGFGGGTPKNLLWIGKDGDNDPNHLPDSKGASCAFGHVIKNINLVLGNNPGAVGISMNVAQRGALEDVQINATGAYAGIEGVPGRSTAVGNIEIVGGQYGIRFIDFPVGISLYGLTLKGQTQRAIAGFAARSYSIVGFKIEKETGPAIETAGVSEESGHLGLYDGSISLSNPGNAIANASQRILSLRNVYMNHARTLFDHGTAGTVAGDATEWVQVKEYSFCPANIGGGRTCWNLIDGVKDRAAHADVTSPSSAPPDTLVNQHIWQGSPPILDAQVVYVTDAPFHARPDGRSRGHSGRDRLHRTRWRQRWQGRIRAAGHLRSVGPHHPQGTHSPLGIPHGQSQFHATDAWTRSLTSNAWVFETVDDPAAETTIEYVWPTWTEPYKSVGIWMSQVRWRVGKNSVMRSVRSQNSGGRCEDKPRQMWRVEGNGGGRWYTWMEEPAQSKDCSAAADMAPNFRKLYITGTTQPLTVYGPNPEHGGRATPGRPANPFIEIVGASNIRFYGLKSETNGTLLVLRNSTNVFFGSVNAHNFQNHGLPLVRVEGCSNVALDLVAAWGSYASPLLTEAGMGKTDVVSHGAEIGIYRRGTIHGSAW